jgi:hypothetical protein
MFEGTQIDGANFAGQTLTNRSFRSLGTLGLNNVNFTGANLSGADLSRNSASRTIFANANLAGANCEGVTFSTSMPNYDLRGVFLRGIDSSFADWSGINLAGTDMTLAVLGPTLNLTGANFEGANMEGTIFSRYDNSAWQVITNANFRGANLHGSILSLITFQDCDFTGADLSFAVLLRSAFHNCIGLDTEQAGMTFLDTTMTNGTWRTGTNPGIGVAPATVPLTLQLSLEGRGTVNLEFEPPQPSQHPPVIPRFRYPGGNWLGEYSYSARGRIAALWLNHADFGAYKFIFRTSTSGQVFTSGSNSGGATYLIGTFTVPQ